MSRGGAIALGLLLLAAAASAAVNHLPPSVQGSSGARYRGDLSEDMRSREGFGIMVFSDGSRYEGHWRNNMMHGQGELSLRNGTVVYRGKFEAGMRHGAGVEYDPTTSKVTYEGEFRHHKRSGRGVAYFSDGGRYDGAWAHGAENGKGTLFGSDGTKLYEGHWRSGREHGYGVEYLEGGDVRYEGQWRKGAWGGKGVLYRLNGSRLEGHWVGSMLQGSATVYLPDGDKYSGRFHKSALRGAVQYYPAKGGSARRHGYIGGWSIFNGVRQSMTSAEGMSLETKARTRRSVHRNLFDMPAKQQRNGEVTALAKEQEGAASSSEEVVVNLMRSEIPAETDVAAPAPAVPAGTYVATGGTDLETAAMGAGSQGQQTGSDGESSVFVNSFAPLDPRAEEAAEEDAAPAAPATQPLEEPAEVREERQQDAAAAVANAAPATTPAESAVDSEALAERKRMAEESFAPLFWDDEEIDIPARPKPAEGAAVGAAADTEAEAQLTQEAPVELPIDEPAGLSREESTELPTKKATQVPKEECLAEVPKEEAAAPTELTKDEPAPGAAPTGVREREPSAVLAARLEEQLEYESGNVMAPLLAPRQRRGGGKTVRRWGLKVAARLGSIQEILKGTPLRERLKAELINDRLKAELINDKRRVK